MLKVLSQGAHFWIFVFESGREQLNDLYELVNFLDFLYAPVNFTESSLEINLGAFLTNLKRDECDSCNFSFMLCCRDGRLQFYITDLDLFCDAHVRVLTEAAAVISVPFLSAKFCSNQPCLKYLSSLHIDGLNGKSVKDLGALIRNCKHLKNITIFYDNDASADWVCDVLGQVKNPGSCTLKIDFLRDTAVYPLTLTSAGAEKLAGLLPRFNNITELYLDVSEYCATAVITLVFSITHKTLEGLGLKGIRLSPAAAAALRQVLPQMSSLKRLELIGVDGSILKAEEMRALFGGFNKPLPLVDLWFCGFSVRGSLFLLTERLRFFPELQWLFLDSLDLNERDFCDLLKSFIFLPNLMEISLSGNPLGHELTSIVPHLTNLPNLFVLHLDETGCSDQEQSYVLHAFDHIRRGL